MKIKDRIKGLRRVKASELRPNPKNWRTHPKEQVEALKGILAEVGFADVAIARECDDGSLMLLDGHLRAETVGGDSKIPVIVLDVNEAEADKILATLDPLGAMAEANASALDELLRNVDTGSQALLDMLTELAEANGILDGLDETEEQPIDGQYTNKITSPIYEPKGERPSLSELTDRTKADQLIAEINATSLPEDIKRFMRDAAERHVVFNFRNVAEYYCHASPELQDLMEKSGLIIIDFDKAIQNGFVQVTDRLGQLADLELSDRDDAS